MAKVVYRSNPFRTNTYQRRMIKIPFLAVFTINALVTFLILFFYKHIVKLISPYSQNVSYTNEIIVAVLFFMWVFFLIITLWSFIVSSNLVGAFERIVRDLDTVILERRKKILKVRDEDHPANELVARINEIIKHTDFS